MDLEYVTLSLHNVLPLQTLDRASHLALDLIDSLLRLARQAVHRRALEVE